MSLPRVFVAGHRGMVGRAIVRRLESLGGVELELRTRAELDLTDQRAVRAFFASTRVDQIYFAAARVGGIHANETYPAEFLYDNLVIQTNVIHAAHEAGVPRLLFLGSSCIYPKLAPQPIVEDALLTGPLEPTNEAYAIAKIAGIKLCAAYTRQYGRDYRSVMPTNLYGPSDNFHPENSHVIPGMLRRFDEATAGNVDAVAMWGTGTPLREFMHVDDMAAAAEHVMNLPSAAYRRCLVDGTAHMNVGTGVDCTIAELAATVARVSGYCGRIDFDATRPDGTPRKLLDVSALHASGWRHTIELEEGLAATREWFVANRDSLRSS